MPGIQVDPSQVQSITVDPSQVSAMPAAAGPVKPRTWLDSASDYAAGAWDNLVQTGQGLVNTVAHPIDTAVGIGKAQDALRIKAEDAFKRGDYAEGARHLLDYVIPVVGPAIDQLGDQAQKGQVARALGGATSLGLQLAGPSALQRTVPPAPAGVAPPEAAGSGLVKSRLNPVQQRAVDFLQDNDVPLNAGTVTGNKFLKGAQALAQNQPLGAGVAARAGLATEQGLARVAGELADQAHPLPATPESAGAATADALLEKIAGLKLQEDEHYGNAWQGMNNPAFAENVPLKTVKVPVPDATGRPSGQMQDSPIMAKVQMPVDVRGVKQQLAPVMDSMSWMPASDRASSAGYQAAKNIIEGPDFIPAQAAEQGLGGLKTMARTDNTNLRNTSQGMAAGVIPDLQEGIDAAVAKTGPDALTSLQNGRAAHASKMEVAEVADKLREEPVQAFNQATWAQDTGIGFLRRIADQAPDVPPVIGRALLTKLFDQATQEGGFSRAQGINKVWENLGPQTKQLLYPNPGLRGSLGNFFLGGKMVADNPNPSGTAVVGSLIPGGMLMIHNPVMGGSWLLGGYAASKLLFSPAGVRLLTGGLKAEAPAAAALRASQILRIAGDDDVTPIPPGGEPPTPPAPTGGNGPFEAPPAAPAEPSNIAPQPSGVLKTGPSDTTIRTGASHDAAGQGNHDQLPGGDAGTAGGAPAVPSATGTPAAETRTPQTSIAVAGSGRSYQASYAVKELADLRTSHNGLSFAPNELYEGLNDRDYTKVENQSKVLNWSMPNQFDARYFINNNPDMGSGPPAIDADGNVLGGNGRGMMLQRTYAYNPKGAQAYRAMLTRDAGFYGLDPAQIAGMKQPVLARLLEDTEIPDRAARQTAITDFNAKSTAALRPEEQAMADSRRVSQRTLDDIGARVEAMGAEGTLAKVLSGAGGVDVLNSMIRDEAISQQEAAAYLSGGNITAAGKNRISQAVLGRFFRDTDQLDRTAAPVRAKLERIAPALAKLEGDGKWNLSPTVQGALDLMEEARASGNNLGDFLSQTNAMGREYPARVADMARHLTSTKPSILADAVRIYGQDAAADRAPEGLFGKPEVPAPGDSLNRGVAVAKMQAKIASLAKSLKAPGQSEADLAAGRDALQKLQAALERM